jgi:ribulose kinase
MTKSRSFAVGVDVGTGSVRAALVDVSSGQIISDSITTRAIKTWHDRTDFYEQSAQDIWNCTCEVVKEAVEKSEKLLSNINIVGIGFDATCSLYALSIQFTNPLQCCSRYQITTAS